MWILAHNFFLLFFSRVCLSTDEDFSSNQALLWTHSQPPQRTSFDFSGHKLTVLTGDSVIITKARLHQKNQIFIRDYIVDLTTPARSGWNLGQQAKRYEDVRFSQHEGFTSHEAFGFEYKLHGATSHSQCVTLCLLDKAHLPATPQQVNELISLHESLRGFFWIEVEQNMSGKVYTLDFDNRQLFPDNFWSNGTTHLFHFHEDRYQVIPSENLHGITTYFDFESNTYYNRQFHSLIARSNVRRDVQILVPVASTAHGGAFSDAMCVCARDLSSNLRSTYVAKALARRARYRTIRSPRFLEIQRVKSITEDPAASNVISILGNPKFYSSTTFSHISPDDLHQLRIEDHRNASHRYKRSLPIAAKLSLIMATKLAQFSLPYAFSHHKNFLKTLREEVKGRLLPVPQITNRSLQEYLSDKFAAGATAVHVLDDRVQVHYDEPESSLSHLAQPSLSHAKQLDGISHDLSYIEKEVLPQISPALLQELVQKLPYALNQGSQVLLRTTTAGTFQRHRFWLELYRHDLSYTNFQAKSLPFKDINGVYTAFSVPNETVLDISRNENNPLMDKSCLTHLLADSDVLTDDLCATKEYFPKTVERIFTLDEGNLYTLHGPAILHLECFQHVTTAVPLNYEFNVVYISASCSASLDKKHKSTIVFATTASFHQHPYQVVVQVNVPKMTSTFQKIYFWLVVLSSTLFLLLICILGVYGFFYYLRYKYRPRLSVNRDGMIDISVNNVLRQNDVSIVSSQMDVATLEEPVLQKEDVTTKHLSSLPNKQSDTGSAPKEETPLEHYARRTKPAFH